MATPSVEVEPRLSGEYVASLERSRPVTHVPAAIHSAKRLEVKTFVMLLMMMLFGTAGNALLDKGMKGLGVLDLSSKFAIWRGIESTLASGAIWLGIGFLLLYMLCNMLVLSWADYSYVMPFTAISYALVALAGYIWLGEKVPPTRWLGIGLIVAGVFLISRTPARTTGSSSAGAN
jgi:drug/metabolite transporter (DMT)-like permease